MFEDLGFLLGRIIQDQEDTEVDFIFEPRTTLFQKLIGFFKREISQ